MNKSLLCKKTVQWTGILLLILWGTSGFSNSAGPLGESSISTNSFSQKQEMEKVISKTFSLPKGSLLNVDNQYGNIVINNWDKSAIDIKVTIRVKGNDEKKMAQQLDRIDVRFKSDNKSVAAKTVISESGASWFGSLFTGDNCCDNMTINYVINMPAETNLQLHNQFGDIQLDDVVGASTIRLDYGNLRAGNILHPKSAIHLEFSPQSTINQVGNAVISGSYSSLNLESGENVQIKMDFSQISITEVAELTIKNDYGKLEVEKVGVLSGSVSFLPFAIGEIRERATLNTSYGSVAVGVLGPDFSMLDINSDFTSWAIGLSPSLPVGFDLNLSMCSLRGAKKFEIPLPANGQGAETRIVYFPAGKERTIRINATYGSIELVPIGN